MRLKLGFFPQNETHIANMAPLAEELSSTYDTEFFLAEDYFKQPILPANFPFTVKKIRRKDGGDGFYKVSASEKIKMTKAFKRELGELSHLHVVIVANDGALQRAFLNCAKNSRKIIILDGIISDYSFSLLSVLSNSDVKLSDSLDWLRRSLRNLSFKLTSLPIIGNYLPSEIGCFPFDSAFVISNYVRDVLIRRNSPIRSYYAVGLPRYEHLYKQKQSYQYSFRTTSSHLRVLFITQGFVWHNEHHNDVMQHETLQAVIKCLELNNKILPAKITVRVHPRDDINRYHQYPVAIQESSFDVSDALAHTDVVIGFSSTLLLESAWIGIPSCSLMLHGQSWKFSRSFLNMGAIPIISNVEDLLDYLLSLKTAEPIQEKDHVMDVFHPFTPDTIKKIVGVINSTIQ